MRKNRPLSFLEEDTLIILKNKLKDCQHFLLLYSKDQQNKEVKNQSLKKINQLYFTVLECNSDFYLAPTYINNLLLSNNQVSPPFLESIYINSVLRYKKFLLTLESFEDELELLTYLEPFNQYNENVIVSIDRYQQLIEFLENMIIDTESYIAFQKENNCLAWKKMLQAGHRLFFNFFNSNK